MPVFSPHNPIFVYNEDPEVTVRAANPMFTHYSWLWWILDDNIEKRRHDEDFWATVPQVPEGWPGPLRGWDSHGDHIFFGYGELTVHEKWAAEFKEDVSDLPALIRLYAPVNLTDIFLDSLAELLRYIDQGQLPHDIQAFVAERTPRK